MVNSKKIFNFALLLAMISFAIIGSMSHLFSLILVIIFVYTFIKNPDRTLDRNSVFLYILLSSIFFISLLFGVFHQNIFEALTALSPMLPIPIISLLILFQKDNEFQITKAQLATYSQIAILATISTFLILTFILWPNNYLLSSKSPRVELLSGNPLPFSLVILGTSIFCLAMWNGSRNTEKLRGLLCFLIGIYFSTYLSGTRTTLFTVFFLAPIIFWYLSSSKLFAWSATIIFFLIGVALIVADSHNIIGSDNLKRLLEGPLSIFEFRIAEKFTDDTFSIRLVIWKAAFHTFWEAPILGYGPTERFNAITSHLSAEWVSFSHPHNDIMAGALSVGLLGVPLVLVSILAPIWASLLLKDARKDKLFLGISLSICFFTMANINTVLFHDITSAWLSFCTFLIWKLKS